MDSLLSGDLTIDAFAGGPGPVRLIWRGKSNDRHPTKVLGPYLAQALDAAAARQTSLEMHFEKLDHFNSSTITALIEVIQDARERSIQLTLIFDSAQKWQKLSFDALRVFAKGDDLFALRPA